MLKAAARGKLDELKQGLDSYPALLDRRGEGGRTLLWEAAGVGRLDVMMFLMEAGSDVNLPGQIPLKTNFPFSKAPKNETLVPLTPLCFAQWKKKHKSAALLLEWGAIDDVFSLAFLGKADALDALLQEQPSMLNVQDPAEDYLDTRPIHHAAAGAQTGAIRLLIERGASVDDPTNRLLTFVVRRNDIESLQTLLDAGAKPQQCYLIGDLEGDTSVAELLVSRGHDVNHTPAWGPLIVRGSRGDSGGDPVPRARWLLAHGADPNATDYKGNTALHVAAKACQPLLVELLISRGADSNARNVDEQTPLHWMQETRAQTGMKETLDALSNGNPDLEATDGRIETALFYAVRRKQTEAVKWLLGRGANAEVKSQVGETLLEVAEKGRRKESEEIAQLIRDALAR
jgi:ankyrin repeat protein